MEDFSMIKLNSFSVEIKNRMSSKMKLVTKFWNNKEIILFWQAIFFFLASVWWNKKIYELAS